MKNKLVSKNPILRFKLGKSIIKALEGTKFGDRVGYIELTGPNRKRMLVTYNPWAKHWYDTNTKEVLPKGYITPDGFKIDGDYAIVANLKNKQGVIRTNISNKYSNNASPILAKKLGEYNRKVSQGIVNPLNDIDITYTPASRFIEFKPKSPILTEFILGNPTTNTNKSSNITPVKPNSTVSTKPTISIKPSSKLRGNNRVIEFLKMLISKGYDIGKTGADGIWGKNTQKAYELYTQDQKLLDLKPLEAATFAPTTINLRQPGQETVKWIPQGQDWRSNLLNVLSLSYRKKGGTLSPKNPITRFKNGGILKFQNAGNLPTAPKAEDRYKDSYKSWNWPQYKEVTAGSRLFPGAKISLTIEGSDTTYMETPPRFPFVKVVPRVAKNNAKTIEWRDLITGLTYPEVRRGNSQEYETLKRRFNTAWNLAK